MRSGKSFLILLAVALAIGAYAYFVESKREVSDATSTTSEAVWTIESDDISEIDVKASNSDVTTLKKTGTEWEIVSPVTAPADEAAVSSIVSSLASLERSRIVDENPPSLEPFELDPPNLSVTLRLSGNGGAKQLDVGTRTPTGAELYARVQGEPRVFLIPSHLENQLNRTTFDLRDKAVLKFDRAQVDALELNPASTPAVSLAKRSSDEWRLTSPLDAEADFSVVDGVINTLSQAQMRAVVDDDGAENLRQYGLDRPQAVATVGVGSTRATLAIGASTPEGTLYARDMTRPLIFTVDASLLDEVKKRPDDVRQKMLFDFRSYTATTLEVTRGGQTHKFVKEPAAAQPDGGVGADVWKQTEPAARDVDLSKMTDFLVDLANLKAETFANQALTSGDEYIFAVQFGNDTAPAEERVTIRKSGATVHGIRQGEPGAAVVPTADFEKVLTELTAVLEAQ